MKLLVKPIYGWGWTDLHGQSVDVPEPFELEVSVLEEGEPFRVAIGRLNECCGHALSGLWVRLSPRHTISDGAYNLVASDVQQGLAELTSRTAVKMIMGFAVARRLESGSAP